MTIRISWKLIVVVASMVAFTLAMFAISWSTFELRDHSADAARVDDIERRLQEQEGRIVSLASDVSRATSQAQARDTCGGAIAMYVNEYSVWFNGISQRTPSENDAATAKLNQRNQEMAAACR